MYLRPFEGPYAKLEQAGRRLVELHELVREYQNEAKPSFVKTERHENPWEIVSNPPLPLTIPLTIGDIAHSLRSALDVMMCDIAIMRKAGVSDMKFPFDETETAFQRRLTGITKNAPFVKLGKQVVDLVCEYKPYKGGNPILRGLHDLNNHDKHRMVLPTTQYTVLGVSLHTMMLSALEKRLRELPPESAKERENVELFKARGFITYSPLGGPTVALREGEPIGRMFYVNEPSEGLSFFNETPRVVFPDGYFLTGEVCSTMSRVTDTVFQMVERFESIVAPSPVSQA